MACRRIWVSWLVLAVGGVCFGTAPARAQLDAIGDLQTLRGARDDCNGAGWLRTGFFRHSPAPCQEAAARIPLQDVARDTRDKVKKVLDKPTIFTLGPLETFTCCPLLYEWLLDHPHHAVAAWRRLGASCTEIDDRGEGRYGWRDGQGSDIGWRTVYRGPAVRVWYAEGQVRGPGLPVIPVRAVVVIRYSERRSQAGRTLIQHQTELFLQTDSRAVALIAKVMHAAAPQEAEKYAGQLEMFFSALSWYLDQHAEKAEAILKGLVPVDTPAGRELHQRSRSPKKSGSTPPSTLTSLRA